MSATGEPLELQLQRERVARAQVESALELTRLQLIEMELALVQARAEATRTIEAIASVKTPAQAPPAAPAQAIAPPVEVAAAATASPANSEAPVKPAAPKPRVRRAAKPAAASLVEVARAAEAIEKQSRATEAAVMTPMAGMVPGREAPPILCTLDLFVDDNRSIVQDFIEHLQTRISKMQGSYGSGNFTELKWHVNWITANATRMGFEPLHGPARALEEVLENQQNERIPALLDEVVQLSERVNLESTRR